MGDHCEIQQLSTMWTVIWCEYSNNQLIYILTTEKLNATGLRWIAELEHYEFKIDYHRGIKNEKASLQTPLSGNPIITAGQWQSYRFR